MNLLSNPLWNRHLRSRVRTAVIGTLLLTATGCLGPRSGGPRLDGADRAAIETGIRTTLDDQCDAWNHGDIDGFMNGYWRSERLSFSGSGGVTRGWQAVRDRYHARYDSRTKMGTLRFSEIQVRPLSTDAAYVLGCYQIERNSADPSAGYFSLVMRRIDGRWLVVHDHTSEKKSD